MASDKCRPLTTCKRVDNQSPAVPIGQPLLAINILNPSFVLYLVYIELMSTPLCLHGSLSTQRDPMAVLHDMFGQPTQILETNAMPFHIFNFPSGAHDYTCTGSGNCGLIS